MPLFSTTDTEAKPVIGMIHVQALPGTPGWGGSMQAVLDAALTDMSAYLSAGIDALMLENMHDVPYLKRDAGPEITAAMSVCAALVKQASGVPCGIQILAGANREALAAAQAANADFIRVEGFAFAHVADEGLMQSCAGNLLRYRRMLGADGIAVYTDIKKKHSSHALTADIDIAETARTARFFKSDGIIVTGESTGEPALTADLQAAKAAVDIPVLIGSGITLDNIARYFPLADGFIVGSYCKKDGYWANSVEYERVAGLMETMQLLRSRNPADE